MINIDWLVASKKNKPTWKIDQKPGSGMILDYLTHCIDYLSWITSFKKMKITIFNSKNNYLDIKNALQSRNDKDYLQMSLTLDDNINVNLRLSNGLPLSYGHRIQLIGSKAIAEINWAFPFLNENTSLELRSVNEKKIYRFFNNSNKKEDTRIEATRNLWLDFQRYVLFGEKGKLVFSKDAVNIHKFLK